jgi:hypothetical protein
MDMKRGQREHFDGLAVYQDVEREIGVCAGIEWGLGRHKPDLLIVVQVIVQSRDQQRCPSLTSGIVDRASRYF